MSSDAGSRADALSPDHLLLPGEHDALVLLAVWYLRQAFFPLFLLGLTVGVLINGGGNFDVELDTPAGAWEGLRSPAAGLILAVALRLAANAAALVLALPVARHFEAELWRRESTSGRIGVLADRINLARAYRALRWTHGARRTAIARLGARGQRIAMLEGVFVALNAGLLVALIAAIALTA
jgi:hypothetical protein